MTDVRSIVFKGPGGEHAPWIFIGQPFDGVGTWNHGEIYFDQDDGLDAGGSIALPLPAACGYRVHKQPSQPVTQGVPYAVGFAALADVSGATITPFVDWSSAGRGYVGRTEGDPISVPTSWTGYAWKLTAPAGAERAHFGALAEAPSGSAALVKVQFLYLHPYAVTSYLDLQTSGANPIIIRDQTDGSDQALVYAAGGDNLVVEGVNSGRASIQLRTYAGATSLALQDTNGLVVAVPSNKNVQFTTPGTGGAIFTGPLTVQTLKETRASSFPGSPSTGDRTYRTDLHAWYYWDGSAWLRELARPLVYTATASTTYTQASEATSDTLVTGMTVSFTLAQSAKCRITYFARLNRANGSSRAAVYADGTKIYPDNAGNNAGVDSVSIQPSADIQYHHLITEETLAAGSHTVDVRAQASYTTPAISFYDRHLTVEVLD